MTHRTRRSLPITLAAILAAAPALVACSSSSSTPASSSSSSSSGGGGGSSAVHESPAPQCHDVAQVADAIGLCGTAGPQSTSWSTTQVPDGTYVMKVANDGQDQCDQHARITVVVSGSKWYELQEFTDPGSTPAWRFTAEVTTDANGLLSFNETCRSVMKNNFLSSARWVATANGFQLVSGAQYAGTDSQNAVWVYERR